MSFVRTPPKSGPIQGSAPFSTGNRVASTRAVRASLATLVGLLVGACGGPTGPDQGGFGDGSDSTSSTAGSSSHVNPTSTGTTSRDTSGTSGRPTTSSSASTTTAAPVNPQGAKKFVGNITTQGQVGNGFAQMWNQITPENESKWGSVEANKGQLNWGQVDAIYDYAKQNDILFKLHPFVWGSQQPNWVASTSGDELAERVENFMKESCARYPDVSMIDVVNEPHHTDPTQVHGRTRWRRCLRGYDWIVNAFKLARKHCPNAIFDPQRLQQHRVADGSGTTSLRSRRRSRTRARRSMRWAVNPTMRS